MINFGNVTKENITENNSNCLEIPDHPNKILIIWRLRIWKNKFTI